jgi:predicted RNase H-like nuclease (RuvC/YqgF family)
MVSLLGPGLGQPLTTTARIAANHLNGEDFMKKVEAQKLFEDLAEACRLSIEADATREDNAAVAAKADALNKDIEQKTEMLKALDAQLNERRAVVEEYEAKHGRIVRLADLDKQIEARTGELRRANQAWDKFLSEHKLAS